MPDIREILQKAEGPSRALDRTIHSSILGSRSPAWACSLDYNATIAFFEQDGCDWIVGSVNGHVGGTPWACVGVREDQASYGATPLISLWLSYFRLKLGDERKNK